MAARKRTAIPRLLRAGIGRHGHLVGRQGMGRGQRASLPDARLHGRGIAAEDLGGIDASRRSARRASRNSSSFWPATPAASSSTGDSSARTAALVHVGLSAQCLRKAGRNDRPHLDPGAGHAAERIGTSVVLRIGIGIEGNHVAARRLAGELVRRGIPSFWPKRGEQVRRLIDCQIDNVAIAGGQRPAECAFHPQRYRHLLPDTQTNGECAIPTSSGCSW